MIQLDFSDHRPLYEQIKENLKELIISGALGENEKIPSVRELASSLAINPNTIQKAYKDLENEGYIYSRRASGSFVMPRSAVAENTEQSELFERFDAIIKEMMFCGISRTEAEHRMKNVYEKGDNK